MPRGVRALIVVMALLLAGFSIAFSLAQVIVRSDPASAYRLAPYDGRIAAAYAAMLATPEANVADRRRSDNVARQAIGRDATAVVAVSTMGFNAALRGQPDAARRLFDYSQALSRREVQTQLWAIEDQVARGDVAGALRHYDIALRVKPALSGILYPVLASANSDPVVRRALLRTLAARPLWGDGFVNYLAAKGPNPLAAARLFVPLHRAGIAVPQFASASVVAVLVSRNQVDAAWNYYATIRPGVDRRWSRDVHFTARLDTPTLFDWLPTNDGSIVASVQGLFDVSASAGIGGTLLQQLQWLPPGDYILQGHGSGFGGDAQVRPYWYLRCPDGRQQGRIALPDLKDGSGFAGRLRVDKDCPLQMLTLVAAPTNAIGGLAGQLDMVELKPEG